MPLSLIKSLEMSPDSIRQYSKVVDLALQTTCVLFGTNDHIESFINDEF